MPMTGLMLQEISGRTVDKSLAVSEVVARGAALHAGIVAAHHHADGEVAELLGDVVEINVNSHSLGIEIKIDGRPASTTFWCRRTRSCRRRRRRLPRRWSRTSRGCGIKVLQGESCAPGGGVHQRRRMLDRGAAEVFAEGSSPVEVTCSVGFQMLARADVVAKDLTSGKAARAEIRNVTGRTEEEIAPRGEAWVRSLDIQ